MGKFLETWTPANCTQLRGLQQNQSVPASWAWQDQSSAGCSPPPHTISLVPGSYRWAVPTQPSLEMLKLRRPWRKPCQEQAAGAASGRQEQQWRKDTKLQIWRVTPKQGSESRTALGFTGPGASTTPVVTYRSQPGPTLHLRSSKYLTGDSVCLAQPHCWHLSLPSGWTLFPSYPGWWCCTEPFPFCFKVYAPFSYVLTVFLQCPLSQVAQPSRPFARSGGSVVWWILWFGFVALLCFFKNTMLLVIIT